MNELSHRTAREVFEDHLRLAQQREFEVDIARNFSPDCVVLTGRGVFRGHEGLLQLAAPDGRVLIGPDGKRPDA